MTSTPIGVVTLTHVTGVNAAVAIMRSCTFKPFSNDPLNGDAGLNAFDVSQSSAAMSQTFAGTGARLTFQWIGPISTASSVPLSPDTLYVHGEFRVFVPVGSTKHLKLVGFEAATHAWDDYQVDLPWHCVTPGSRRRARAEALVDLQDEIDAILAKQPLIRVGV